MHPAAELTQLFCPPDTQMPLTPNLCPCKASPANTERSCENRCGVSAFPCEDVSGPREDRSQRAVHRVSAACTHLKGAFLPFFDNTLDLWGLHTTAGDDSFHVCVHVSAVLLICLVLQHGLNSHTRLRSNRFRYDHSCMMPQGRCKSIARHLTGPSRLRLFSSGTFELVRVSRFKKCKNTYRRPTMSGRNVSKDMLQMIVPVAPFLES